MNGTLVWTQGLVKQKQLSNNFPSIFNELSNYSSLPQRSYKDYGIFTLKKLKKVRSNNLTLKGYGKLCVADSLS